MNIKYKKLLLKLGILGTIIVPISTIIACGTESKKEVIKDKVIAIVKTALTKLSSKEVTIVATSGTITENKAAILAQIKLLDGYSDIEFNGVEIAIKEDSTPMTTKGIEIKLELSLSGGTSIEVIGFKAKRTSTSIEKIKNYFADDDNKIILIPNSVLTINLNTNAKILIAIKSYLANDDAETWTLARLDLLNVKDDQIATSLVQGAANINFNLDYITIQLAHEATVKQIANNKIIAAKEAIEKLVSKEVTITETSGTITENKAAILTQIEALSGYSAIDFVGVEMAIKDDATSMTTAGVTITLVFSLVGGDSQESIAFRAKISS